MKSNIFEFSSVRIALAITVVFLFLVIAYTIYLSNSEHAFTSWIQQILTTVLAVSFAVLFGVFIYAKQIIDNRNRTREVLRFYLEYILREFSTVSEPDSNALVVKHINRSLINQVLSTGHAQDLAPQLIKLQSYIDYHQQFSNLIIDNLSEQSILPNRLKTLIINSENMIYKQSKECINLLGWESPHLQD